MTALPSRKDRSDFPKRQKLKIGELFNNGCNSLAPQTEADSLHFKLLNYACVQ